MMIALLVPLALAMGALARLATTSEPALSEIREAQATTLPEVSTSDVKGVAFNRFYQIWLENIDFEASAADKNQEWFASRGILLSNFYAVAHPSEPNYCAAAGGDTFGMDNDNFHQIPENVSTVADLLDTKSISWAEYQEHSPFPGYQGYNFSNQETHAPDYVRKHNPLVLYNSVMSNDTRARQIKNFTDFDNDLKNKKLPQWAFITPNMTNDAHDTTIEFGAAWERRWLEPLLNNSYFMKDTVILLTYDEDRTYNKTNRIFSVLIGGGVPENLKGTVDDTFYTHYSTIATVSANWGLPSLGRWDCGANIFEFVAKQTHYENYKVDTTHLHLNNTYPGPLSDNSYSNYSNVWPNPVTEGECSAGHGILEAVKKTYGKTKPTYNYTFPFPWEEKSKYNLNVTATRKVNGTSTKLASAAKKTSAATIETAPGLEALAVGLVGIFACLLL
ncbi:phosphoesterase-domain-containing protein [Penicillium angulare]|uniref:acid phosphatase n=1 Tax=Penicillium angulare TaxID=116970 RepID=A0A9W9FVP4_9EURO|nr:phosphoesterase-domain-containing protein [Penicillium angulare]